MEDLESKKVVLLDWDDSVVKTHEEIIGIYLNFARISNLRVPSSDEIRSLWGNPLKKMLTGLWPELNANELHEDFVASVPRDHVVEPFPGTEEALEKLARTHILGVVSSTPRKGLESTLRKFPRLAAIDFIHFQTGEDCDYHKPDPRVFDAVLEKIKAKGIGHKEVVYGGDALVDFEAARNARLTFVAFLTGFTTKDQFLKAGLREKLILEDFTRLPAKLAQSRG